MLRLARKRFLAIFNRLSQPGKPASVRTHLVLLVLAAVLPLLIFAALMFWRDLQLRQDVIEGGMRDTARALSLAVDREIGSILSVAQTLAASQYVDSRDFKGFYDLSVGAAENNNSAAIALFDQSGQMIINTVEHFGVSLPNPLQGKTPESKQEKLPQGNQAIKTVLQNGQPVFSDLFQGLVSKLNLLSVTVPVVRHGKIVYALSVAITSAHLTDLLREQGLPVGWMAVLVDKKGITIARTIAPEKFVGQPAFAPLVKNLSLSEEGWDTGSSQEGNPIYYSFARSKLTGWGVAIAAPQALIDAPMQQSIAILTGGVALLLLLAVGAAFLFGRRISVPISRLAQSAQAIQRGASIELSESAVAEVEQLHRALSEASAAARAADAEREQRLVAEAKRAEAEKAQETLRQFATELESRVAERTDDLREAHAALLRDIEERKKLEEQLVQAQKMESIGTLAGGIAHDFNNILNIIRGYAFLLREIDNDHKQREESLKVIDDTVQRGTALVQQLLTVAQKTSGEPIIIDLNLLIEGLLKIVRETFPKNIEVNFSLAPEPLTILADKTQIEQVLLNLLVNARDAMPDGGRLTLETYSVPNAKLKLHEPTADRYVCIRVNDTGIGMDQSTRNRIFEPFFTTKNKSLSAGLGLSVVYGIIKKHKGFIEVESMPGCGSTFLVYFPITTNARQSIPERAQAFETTTTGPDYPSTILIVEDEVTALNLLAKVLSGWGYNILQASDGEMAIELFEHYKGTIAAVLLDLGLPKITGIEVLHKIKTQNPAMKVIIASGYFEADVKADIDRAGVKTFLQKPYRPDEIIKTLHSVIQGEP